MIDITMAISPDMPVWPGDQLPVQRWNERIADGASANVSHWVLGSHTGTHVDAPSHFVEGGSCIEQMSLESLVGACEVVDVADDSGLVTRGCLAAAWPNTSCSRILLKTRNSRRESATSCFNRTFVALDVDAAQFLIDHDVATIGIDYLSIERFVDEAATEPEYAYPVHHRLLAAGISIIEGLDLSAIASGRYELCCLPLRLVGSEAAPARALLRPLSEVRAQ